jgi:hypothetical protein
VRAEQAEQQPKPLEAWLGGLTTSQDLVNEAQNAPILLGGHSRRRAEFVSCPA